MASGPVIDLTHIAFGGSTRQRRIAYQILLKVDMEAVELLSVYESVETGVITIEYDSGDNSHKHWQTAEIVIR